MLNVTFPFEIRTRNSLDPRIADFNDLATGYIFLLISSLAWGGCYLPVKHFDSGDGVCFNLFMSMSIWLTGPLINWIRGFPKFYILPVFGGFIWSLANVFSVAVVKLIGIGKGSLIWNMAGFLNAWIIPRYGLFGLKAQVPKRILLNYLGVLFALLSIIIFVFIKTVPSKRMQRIVLNVEPSEFDENSQLINQSRSDITYEQNESILTTRSIFYKSKVEKFIERRSERSKRILGTLLGIISGMISGFSCIPIIYCQDNYKNASQDFNDYHFSYVSGCLLGSIFIFFFYWIIENNNLKIKSEAIIPAFIVGLLWVVGQIGYNFSSNSLSQSVVIPVVNCGPSAISFVIGLVYKEIKYNRNYILLAFGLLFALIGSVFCSLSD